MAAKVFLVFPGETNFMLNFTVKTQYSECVCVSQTDLIQIGRREIQVFTSKTGRKYCPFSSEITSKVVAY